MGELDEEERFNEEDVHATRSAGVFPADGSDGRQSQSSQGVGDDERSETEKSAGGGPEGPEEEREGKGGFVYFFETNDGAFIKIGCSSDVARRLKQLGLKMPGLRVLGYIPGTFATERWIHAKFAKYRSPGILSPNCLSRRATSEEHPIFMKAPSFVSKK